jgi:hypothetical protein
MNAYFDELDEIRERREPRDGVYLDKLSSAQRQGLLAEQKMELAEEARERTAAAYAGELERYGGEVGQRRSHLKEKLFRVEDAGALSRAALASDTELGVLMEVAAQTGNVELGRAAFVASEQRGLGDLVHAFINRIDPSTRELYQEWTQLPTEEDLSRQVENVDRVVQPPSHDRLTMYARATT